MSVLDSRQLRLPAGQPLLPVGFLMDPSTASALLQNKKVSDGGGKMNSFRISDLLEKREREESPLRRSPSVADDSVRGSPSEDSSPSSAKKARKARTIFTDKQLQELETTFEKQKYLSVQDRMDLAHRMGLSDTQVKTWYQNRRTKWKRQASVGIDLLSDSSNMAAVQQLLRTNPYWAGYLGAMNPLAPMMPPLGHLPSSLPLMMALPPFPMIPLPKADGDPRSTPDS